MKPARECIVEGCDNLRKGHGLCRLHYMRKRRGSNDTSPAHWRSRKDCTAPEQQERIRANVIVDEKTGCWNWAAGLSYHGYSNAKGMVDGIPYYNGHRLSYAAFKGHIPAKDVVHHMCINPACVNPDHLQLVSQRENVAEWMFRKSLEAKIQELQLRLQNCACGGAL